MGNKPGLSPPLNLLFFEALHLFQHGSVPLIFFLRKGPIVKLRSYLRNLPDLGTKSTVFHF